MSSSAALGIGEKGVLDKLEKVANRLGDSGRTVKQLCRLTEFKDDFTDHAVGLEDVLQILVEAGQVKKEGSKYMLSSSPTTPAGRPSASNDAHLMKRVHALEKNLAEVQQALSTTTGLSSRMDLLERELAGLRNQFRPPPRQPGPNPAPPGEPTSVDNFRQHLKTVFDQLRRRHITGMVPIPELRGAFDKRWGPRSRFSSDLLDLEKNRLVDLHAANDRDRADAHLAVSTPNRGLLYFLTWRD